MNILNDNKRAGFALLHFLALIDVGTMVYVDVIPYDLTVYMRRIDRAGDVLELCDKARRKLQHAPTVVNVATMDINGESIIRVGVA